MKNPSYNLKNLRQMLAESPAYQSLPPEKQANIEEHIRENNKPVLMYIFYHLLEEKAAINLSREKLAKKVLTPDPSALSELHKKLQSSFPKPQSDTHSGPNLL